MLASILVEAKKLTVEMVPVVREYLDMFLEELLGLPPIREVELGIDVMLKAAPISKQPYRMAPIEMNELKT